MKASILTFSQTGNTLKVGNSIAKGLQEKGFETEHERFLQRKKWDPQEADVIGIGSPVFEFGPPECITDFLNETNIDFTNKKAFVFITSSGSPMNTLWRLAEAVAAKGATIIGGVQLRGMDTFPTLFGHFEGRPNQNDLAIAEQYGHAIAANVKDGVELPGHFRADQEKEGKKFPDFIAPILLYMKDKTIPIPECDLEKCILCGNCIYDCPTDNIKINKKAEKPKTIHVGEECIRCYRCWHVCPTNAISMKMTPFKGLIERKILTGAFMRKKYSDLKPGEEEGPDLYKDVLSQRIKLKYNRKNPTAEYEYVE